MKLNVKVVGRGPALVFFHGWGFDHSIWLPLTAALEKDFQLYLVDLPGFGESDFCDWEEFKAELLSKLPKEFILIGWSLGGLMATRLAFEEAKYVSRLISVASSPRFIKDKLWPGIEEQTLSNFSAQFLANPKQTQENFIQSQLANSLFKFSEFKVSEAGLVWGLETLKSWDLRSVLTQINQPVSFMFGRLDSIVPRNTLQTMESEYPNFHYKMFRKAGHIPFLSDYENFIEELYQFLRKD